jgi:hypothetical protein
MTRQARSAATHPVRPRWVWASLTVLIVGLALSGYGVAILSWAWSLTGVAVVAVGAALALYGGLLYDVHTRGSAVDELREVAEGGEHQGIDPDARLGGRAAQHAVQVERSRRHVLEARAAARGRPDYGAIGAFLCLTVCAWLAIAQWGVLSFHMLSEATALRGIGVGVVAALSAWRVLLVGARWTTGLLIIATGSALILFGILLRHLSATTEASEITCGVLLVLAGGLVVTGRAIRRDRVKAST